MSHIFDASCLLNLVHGNALNTILDLSNITGRLGPIVFGECKSIKPSINAAIASGRLTLLNDNTMSASQFIVLLDTYNLGPGETECIAIAKTTPDRVCMDDAKARKAAALEIGTRRVTGTLGLLRLAVMSGMCSEDQAFSAYVNMLVQGAFLPRFDRNGFVQEVLGM